MSLFRGENPTLGRFRLDQVGAPQIVTEGDIWNDATLKSMQAKINGLQGALSLTAATNVTPVTATNPNPVANLMSYAVPAGALNASGKGLYIFGSGLYTTAAAQTPTIAIAVKLGSVTLLTFTSTATTASQTNFPWNFEAFLVVNATGATGTLECHGSMNILLGASATGAISGFNDVTTAVSSTLDLTAAQTLQVTALMSSSNAGNSVAQRSLVVQTLN